MTLHKKRRDAVGKKYSPSTTLHLSLEAALRAPVVMLVYLACLQFNLFAMMYVIKMKTVTKQIQAPLFLPFCWLVDILFSIQLLMSIA